MVRGEEAGRGPNHAPETVRTSTAVGPRSPFWCSEPRMKISSQGLSQLRTTPQPARSQATRPSRLVRAESLQRHQPSASGVPSRHANLTRATEGSTRHRCRRWTLLSSTSHFIFHAVFFSRVAKFMMTGFTTSATCKLAMRAASSRRWLSAMAPSCPPR